jgi:predicted dienelactone hydrolase
MSYDPFTRGRYPVGVCTIEFRDGALSARPVPVELWYPATDAHRGQDRNDATRDRFTFAPGLPTFTQNAVRDATPIAGVFPTFLYFHGGYGHRRESTGICTHMASHGYLVAAFDFPGDNYRDLLPDADGSAAVAKSSIDESARRRPAQASAFINRLLTVDLPGGPRVNPDAIGTGGISMGGFTSLAINSVDRRPKASFPMCPMFGTRSLSPQVRRLRARTFLDDDLERTFARRGVTINVSRETSARTVTV